MLGEALGIPPYNFMERKLISKASIVLHDCTNRIVIARMMFSCVYIYVFIFIVPFALACFTTGI
jgi:hypothetical protein